MKIALIQTNPQSNFNENLKNITAHIRTAAQMGADVVMCPETFLFMGHEQERKKLGQEMGKGVFAQMQSLAQELHVYLIAGSIDEISDSPMLATDFKFYNTCVTFDPNGKMISKYRKLHLFNLFDDAGKPIYCESNVYKVGSVPNIYEMKIPTLDLAVKPRDDSNEIWEALNIICYDIRFPEIIRHPHKHSDVIFVPAAFTWQTGQDHWEVLLRARAIENQCFVVACNQTGFSNEGQKRNYGNSMVVDPWGKIIARLGEEEGVLFCEISKTDIGHSRAKLPALKDRKIF